MAEKVGGSLLESTVSRNDLLALAGPSLTFSVTVAVPDWLAAGVTVTVRLAPLPPNVMLAPGTRVGLEELPDSARLASGVSTSPIVNAIGPAGTCSSTV